MKKGYKTTELTYRQAGNYLLPNLEVPKSPKVGVWGERRRFQFEGLRLRRQRDPSYQFS